MMIVPDVEGRVGGVHGSDIIASYTKLDGGREGGRGDEDRDAIGAVKIATALEPIINIRSVGYEKSPSTNVRLLPRQAYLSKRPGNGKGASVSSR